MFSCIGWPYTSKPATVNVTPVSLPPEVSVMLRESTTLASTGQTTIDSAPGGGFMISSFFDIFTEVSLDGGATWTRQFDGAFWPLTSAAFLDANTGTVAGFWGTIVHTTTGGE